MAGIVAATEDTRLYSVLEAELSSFQFEVYWAISGDEALETAVTHSPAAIVIDSGIQRSSLWELCRQLREHPDLPGKLPIFILSDDDLSPRKVEAFGIAEVLSKSHDTAQLRELLFQHVDAAAL